MQRERIDGGPGSSGRQASVVVVDAASRTVLLSSTVRTVVGRNLDELAQLDEFALFHPDGRRYAPSEWQLARTLAHEEVILDERAFSYVGEDRVDLSISSYPVYDGRGDLVAAVAAAHDTAHEIDHAYHASLLDNIDDAVVGTDPEFNLTIWSRGAERLYGFRAQDVLGRPAREVASHSGDESRVKLERDLLETDRTRTQITAFRADGSPVDVELISVAVRDPAGTVTGYLGIHRDVTAQKRAAEEGMRRAHQQSLIAALGMRALGAAEPQAAFEDAVEVVADGLGVPLVSIAELREDGDTLLLRAGVGWPGRAAAPVTVATSRSLVGFTVTAGEAVVSDDAANDPRFEVSPVLSRYSPASAAAVVIPGRRQPFGALAAASTAFQSFSAEDIDFLQAVANVVSAIVDRARSEARIVEVREAERARIARDLHDEALQELTDALAHAMLGSTPGAGDAADRLARLVPALKRAGQQVRAAIYDLRLDEVAHGPLRESLSELVSVQRELAGDCRIELDVAEEVPDDALGGMATELVQAVREALVNARRHSGGRTIEVKVWSRGAQLCVEVSDDGRGFDVDARFSGRNGIKGMRERAELIGADLEITSSPAGTAVRFSVPLTDEESEPALARVVLVEDHVTVREAIAAMFMREPDFDVVGQASTLAEARPMLKGADVVLVDLRLPDGFGADLIKHLREVNPGAQALVLSAAVDRGEIARAVESGAAGTLNKTVALDEVVDAVRRVRAGEMLVPLGEVVELLRLAARERDREHDDRLAIEKLTAREREVLQLLAEGLDSQHIAARLHISLRTERNHVASIFGKLGVHSRLQAVLFGLRYDAVRTL